MGSKNIKDLTRLQWKDLKQVLGKVPTKDRNESWELMNHLVDQVMDSQNPLSIPAVPSELRWAPECVLCKKGIFIDQDYVVRKNFHMHYDCHDRSDAAFLK